MQKTVHDLVQEAKAEIQEISVDDVLQRHLTNSATIIDVREHNEYHSSHLPGAHHIPRGLIEFSLDSHPALDSKEQEIIVYCKAGGRAALAAHQLKKLGYKRVRSIAGGIDAWTAANYPLEPL